MTVKELIEILKEYPEHMEVMYEDGEYGNTDIIDVEVRKDYDYKEKKEYNYISLS